MAPYAGKKVVPRISKTTKCATATFTVLSVQTFYANILLFYCLNLLFTYCFFYGPTVSTYKCVCFYHLAIIIFVIILKISLLRIICKSLQIMCKSFWITEWVTPWFAHSFLQNDLQLICNWFSKNLFTTSISVYK